MALRKAPSVIAAVAIAALALVGLALAAVIWAVRLILGRVDQWQLDYAARQDDRVEAERARWELEAAKRELAAADDHITALVQEATDETRVLGPRPLLQLAEQWRRRRAVAAGEVPPVTTVTVPAGATATAAGTGPGRLPAEPSDVPADRPD